MARKKKLFSIPFISFKINSKTIINIVGFLVLLSGIISLLSFFTFFQISELDGRLLEEINHNLIEWFGALSIFVPFIIIMFSGHFFNGKKVKLIRFNVSFGTLMLFVAILGAFQSGKLGKLIFDNLTQDFSLTGCLIILFLTFIIGLVLFLDTSIDVFLIFAAKSSKAGVFFLKNHVLRSVFSDKSKEDSGKKQAKGKEQAFIRDQEADKINSEAKKIPIPTIQPAAVIHIQPKKDIPPMGLNIKPNIQTTSSTWVYPPLNLLQDVSQKEALRGDVKKNADTIEKTLDSFGIRARVAEVNFGPAVTQYALEITMGTKLTKITSLSNDLALALATPTGTVRIEAPIPGRSLVGIEIPNIRPEIVTLKQMLSSPIFTSNPDPLLVPMGLDVAGAPIAATIGKMPHVLIAGTTGSGKSVLLNAWITTFLFRTKPSELQMILIDPKRVELASYNGIPHLLTEVIVEPDKILSALKWTVGEMENRYKIFAKAAVRNLDGYNKVPGIEKKPYILFVIDELADLMMFASSDAEDLITRIAQMARATGIHLILATQRPSVDVITGLMKANIPSRVAFSVSSMIDSRVIIDSPGAEKLLGKGDMLYLPADQAKPRRIQGAFITEKEVHEVVNFLRSQVPEVHYTEEITEMQAASNGRGGTMVGNSNGEQDPFFNQAVEIISQFDKASASLLQRRLKVGYARAARLLDELEAAGFVSPAEGSKPREVIKRSQSAEVPVEGMAE